MLYSKSFILRSTNRIQIDTGQFAAACKPWNSDLLLHDTPSLAFDRRILLPESSRHLHLLQTKDQNGTTRLSAIQWSCPSSASATPLAVLSSPASRVLSTAGPAPSWSETTKESLCMEVYSAYLRPLKEGKMLPADKSPCASRALMDATCDCRSHSLRCRGPRWSLVLPGIDRPHAPYPSLALQRCPGSLLLVHLWALSSAPRASPPDGRRMGLFTKCIFWPDVFQNLLFHLNRVSASYVRRFYDWFPLEGLGYRVLGVACLL